MHLEFRSGSRSHQQTLKWQLLPLFNEFRPVESPTNCPIFCPICPARVNLTSSSTKMRSCHKIIHNANDKKEKYAKKMFNKIKTRRAKWENPQLGKWADFPVTPVAEQNQSEKSIVCKGGYYAHYRPQLRTILGFHVFSNAVSNKHNKNKKLTNKHRFCFFEDKSKNFSFFCSSNCFLSRL